MMRILRSKKAQNTAEYAILIALVIAAAMAIQTYVKRGLQARVRDAVIKYQADTADLGPTGQYEPYYLKSDFTTDADSSQTNSELDGGGWTRDVTTDTQDRSGFQEFTAPVSGG
jgi:hypothetical protein